MTEIVEVEVPRGAPPARDVLLDVRNLKTHFRVLDGLVPAGVARLIGDRGLYRP